jgi:YYY domain-containing protein
LSNWLLWLFTLELLGLAGLPIAAVLFRSLPDRGYGLSKPLGILLVTFLNFWLGSVAGLANQPILLWVLAVAVFVGGAVLLRPDLSALLTDRRSLLRTIAIEEALFIGAFAAWTWVRQINPDIYATEKPMDFMLLQVSGMSHSFPPPDAWLSGHTVNYYYLGYAIFGMLGRMAGVDSRYGFDLANITIFALGCAGGYSLTYALIKSRVWGFAGAFALIVAGNLDGFVQFLARIVGGGPNGAWLSLWCSTRVIDGGCTSYRTIAEFPIFSVLWNDLHPHLMALPFAVLAVGLAVGAILDARFLETSPLHWYTRLVLAAVVLGALFPINSWDYPTYLILTLIAFYVAAYRSGELSARIAAEIGAVLPASLLLYLPYYLTVHNSKGVSFKYGDTPINDMIDVIGGLLAPLVIFAIWRTVHTLARIAEEPEPENRFPFGLLHDLPTGAGWWIAGIAGLFLAAVPGRTDFLLVIVIALALYPMTARLWEEDGTVLMLLGLLAAGAIILLVGDFVYLPDLFDNGPNYRMNTVFKLYYQAWILLAVGVPASIALMIRAVPAARRSIKAAAIAAAVVLAAALAIYPLEGPAAQSPTMGVNPGLDGLAYLQQTDLPDYKAIVYIRDHVAQDAVIAEADGADGAGSSILGSCTEYWVCSPQDDVSRISALTGRPTIIGWTASHEALWQGAYGTSASAVAASAMLSQREADVRTLYITTNQAQAISIIQRYHVNYVYVGALETTTYEQVLHAPASALSKFANFLHPVFSYAGSILYQVPANLT